MKFKAWWHAAMWGHRQVERHYSVPLGDHSEGIVVHCWCGERFSW